MLIIREGFTYNCATEGDSFNLVSSSYDDLCHSDGYYNDDSCGCDDRCGCDYSCGCDD